MGRRSIKENKNIYQESREEAGMTRAAASDATQFLSESRIEKIESEKSLPHPEEVLAMASAYKKPGLCNWYCSHECPIGQEYVPEVKVSELSQIVLEMLASLNALNNQKERLVEITVDGAITSDELRDFAEIRRVLGQITMAVDSLQLWCDSQVMSGKLDRKELERVENLLKQKK